MFKSNKQTVIVTGASGFIGSHLYNLLLEEGYKVVLFIRKKTQKQSFFNHENLSTFVVNFNDENSLYKALCQVNAHVLIHCAGTIKGINYKDYYSGITYPTKNLVEASLKLENPPFFIYLSSASACGPSKDLNNLKNELSPLEPISNYGKAKKEAEEVIAKTNLRYSIIRPVAVYGAKDKAFIAIFRSAKWRIKIVLGRSKNTIDLIYVDDLVQMIYQILKLQPHKEIFIAGDGVHYSQSTVLDSVMKTVYTNNPKWWIKIVVPKYLVLFSGFIVTLINKISRKTTFFNYDKAKESVQYHWSFDTSKAHKILLTPKGSLLQKLSTVYDWYKKNDIL